MRVQYLYGINELTMKGFSFPLLTVFLVYIVLIKVGCIESAKGFSTLLVDCTGHLEHGNQTIHMTFPNCGHCDSHGLSTGMEV